MFVKNQLGNEIAKQDVSNTSRDLAHLQGRRNVEGFNLFLTVFTQQNWHFILLSTLH